MGVSGWECIERMSLEGIEKWEIGWKTEARCGLHSRQRSEAGQHSSIVQLSFRP